MKPLTPNQYWLRQHQITAFWHGFGLSNGLQVPKEQTREIYISKSGKYTKEPTKSGKIEIEISREYMHKLLVKYCEWLAQYKNTWEEDVPHPNGIDTYDKFLEDESYHKSRMPILKMIELLQD